MWKYLWQLAATWVGLMSGIASVVLAIIATYKDLNSPGLVFWVPAFICLLAAVLLLWSGINRKVKELEHSLGEAMDKKRSDHEAEVNRQQVLANTLRQQGLSHVALTKLKGELDELIAWSKTSRPMEGPARELEQKTNAHAFALKNKLDDWLRRARAEAAKVSLSNFLPDESETHTVQYDHYWLDNYAARQLEGIKAIIGKLT